MILEQWQKHWNLSLNDVYSTHEARSFLIAAINHRFQWSAIDLVTRKDAKITDNDLVWLSEVLERLKNHEPIQQILGYTWFCDQKFFVNSAALIPRPETEELVMYLRQSLKNSSVKNALDIGTGSGCIALSLAAVMPQTNWSAWDVSPEALALAQKNQQKFKQQVHWQLQDVLHTWPDQNFDLIVSNPPYIPEAEMSSLDKNVLEFEPHLALFVPDSDPLKFYRAIATQALNHLNQGGLLYFECHYQHAQNVAQLMKDLGFAKVHPRQDQWDKWRFVSGVKP
jgi:release factor glutamine methyltransferase